jgi:hypothetical protein
MIYINSHEIVLDKQERLEPWTTYDRVVTLAMNFIKHCPVDERNQLPWYLQYSCFWTDPLRPTIWPDNPTGKFAWAVTTLLKYYPYSGDASFIEITRQMLDRLWEYRTPDHFDWAGIPYASAHPGTGIYFGARADGEYATECDKIAQAGRAFVDFYEMTLEEKYLAMGRQCAEVLAKHIRSGDASHSPWPFRVDVRDGRVIEEYTANMIQAVRLFDELIYLGEARYQPIRQAVWTWIETYPLANNLWKGYFEDIRLDPNNENRDQLSALETARYLLELKNLFTDWQSKVKGLIDWVKDTLGGHPFFTAIPIHEQKFCYFPMGSHTARFASLNNLYAEATGNSSYREQGIRSFNWASYTSNEDGTVTVGVDRPDYYNQCWFTDGYFDYVPHFIDGMAAVPELAPADSDHLLRSKSVVQKIDYQSYKVSYRLFDVRGSQKLRLTFKPVKVMSGGTELSLCKNSDSEPGWSFSDENLNVITVHPAENEVVILGR